MESCLRAFITVLLPFYAVSWLTAQPLRANGLENHFLGKNGILMRCNTLKRLCKGASRDALVGTNIDLKVQIS